MKQDMSGKQYISTIVYVFLALGTFIVAIVSAYFAAVGLFFGQAVVETEVFVGGYKYECNNANQTASTCTNLSTTEIAPYQDYAEFRTSINNQVPLYLGGAAIMFSLLSLVFLFLALKASGIGGKAKSSKKESEY